MKKNYLLCQNCRLLKFVKEAFFPFMSSTKSWCNIPAFLFASRGCTLKGWWMFVCYGCIVLPPQKDYTSSKSLLCLSCFLAFLVYYQAGFSAQDFSFLCEEMFRRHPPHFHSFSTILIFSLIIDSLIWNNAIRRNFS